MKSITLTSEQSRQLTEIYRSMQHLYRSVAEEIDLSCTGCPDNCCDSYFLHYTYAEWAYLWEGLQQLDEPVRQRITSRAERYVEECKQALSWGDRPRLMCPLNEDGLCIAYSHRLMICRLHGIPAAMTRPDGQTLRFPGCFRCQELVGEKYSRDRDVPFMNRSQLLSRVAALESELLDGQRHLFPKVRLTIAEMITKGPPQVDKPFCER